MFYCEKDDICADCPNIPGSDECENCYVQEVCLEADYCEECCMYRGEDND